jgi:hypothetical protein
MDRYDGPKLQVKLDQKIFPVLRVGTELRLINELKEMSLGADHDGFGVRQLDLGRGRQR